MRDRGLHRTARNRPRPRYAWLCVALFLVTAAAPAAVHAWVDTLEARIARIDAETPGNLGVYVKRLDQDRALSHEARRNWYLASTIKIPVAIVLLQMVEAGELSLDDELTLKQSDYVDGAGDLVWQDPGGRYSLRTLLQKMIVNSDSTATDMLIRLIGEEELNRRIHRSISTAFQPFTTILQVRYEAYGELHPSVRELSNMDIIRLKVADPGEARLRELVRLLPVDAEALRAPSIEAAFERYYARGLNSGSLAAYGHMLERLTRGELLSPEHTSLVLEHMQSIRTGDDRIKAGLPAATPFAQKTGTQLARACNVGIVRPDAEAAVVVAACIEKFDDLDDAERTLAKIGEALMETGVVP